MFARRVYDGSLTLTQEQRFVVDGGATDKPRPTGTENFDTVADLDGSNALVTRRMYTSGFDNLAAKLEGASTGWYNTDYLGSVRSILDNSNP